MKHGRKISVHEIRTGDVIYAEGAWADSGFAAVKIRVNDDSAVWRDYDRARDYRTFQGRIEKIDCRERQFILDIGSGERTVYADRARIWRRGDICAFEDLRRGDKVWVRGNVNGKSLDAERIEVARAK